MVRRCSTLQYIVQYTAVYRIVYGKLNTIRRHIGCCAQMVSFFVGGHDMGSSTLQQSTVQCGAVQYTIQSIIHTARQYSTVQCTIEYVMHFTLHYTAAQCSITLQSIIHTARQHDTVQYSIPYSASLCGMYCSRKG
ncbi:unnamed protein product [Discosporangium mesarthrocarpum]